jgi:MFS family permease
MFIRQYAAEFGWTRGEIALQAMSTLSAGLLAPIVGRMADRFGVRPIIIASITGFALTCIGMANQTGDIRLYYVLYFLLVFFGLGTGGLAWTRFVSAAFDKSRGLALSVSLSLITFAAMAAPPAMQWIIAEHGWRMAWYALGALCFGMGLVALAIAPKKESVRGPSLGNVSTLKHAARVPAFWLAVIGMFLINIPSGGIMNQMNALISDKGFTDADAALVMSAFGLSVLIGRLIAGLCLDRFPTGLVAFVSMALPALGCALLTSLGGGVVVAVIAGIVLAGLSQGAEGDIGPYLVAKRFGFGAFAGINGALGAATIAGTAGGTILFGRSFDSTGNYDFALWVGAAAFIAGALCYLAIDRGRGTEA